MRSSFKILLVCAITNLAVFSVMAQGVDLTRPVNIQSPSVNVASLMKFIDIPVSYYTGTPQISFPIYAVQNNKIGVNIGLSYNSSGIKVEEDAGWVGLGWNLLSGGSISRIIVGKPDEKSNNYRQNAQFYGLPLFNEPTPEMWLQSLTACEKKSIAEVNELLPDIYYLNFNGYSAKMYFDKNGAPLITPYKAWKVSGTENTGFKVTVEDGTIYEFNAVETSGTDISSNADSDPGSFTQGNTAWFLTKMISSNLADTIKFNYTPVSYELNNKNNDETYIDLVAGQTPPACAGIPNFNNRIVYVTNQTISTQLLSSIESRLERVDFLGQGGRSDVDGTYGGLDYKLDEVRVYKKAGNVFLKGYKFNYSYFEKPGYNQAIYKRLMLINYQEFSPTESLTYSFDYHRPTELPARNEKSQDHWGFNNGAFNNTLIPVYNKGAYDELSGANREPAADKVGIGLLSRIKYPTGGTVDFTYEANEYSYVRGQYVNEDGKLNYELVNASSTATTATLSTPSGTKTTTFTLGTQPGIGPARLECLVKGKIYGDALAEVSARVEGEPISPFTYKQSGDTHGSTYVLGDIGLPGNTITLTASRDMSTELAKITAFYKKAVPSTGSRYSKLGGGVRIKTITESGNPDSSKNLIKTFKYNLDDTLSSGRIMNLPVYENYSYVPIYCTSSGGLPVKMADLMYFNRHSVSMVNRNQGSVGYSKVTVLFGENGENGKEEYHYSSGPSDSGGSGFPFIPYSSYDDLRGLLLKKITYANNGTVLQSEENTYDQNIDLGDPNFKWIFGAKYGIRKQNNQSGTGGCPDTWDFMGGMYKMFQFWPVLTSTKSSLLDVSSGTYTTNTRNFKYNPSNLLLSSETRFKSNGDSTVYKAKYPIDYLGEPVYDALVNKNIINKLIEKTIFTNIEQVYKEKSNYDFWSNNVIAPKTIEIQNGNFPSEIRHRFFSYDKYENVVEASKEQDSPTVYVWGCSGKYLMAEVKGSDYSAVSQLINQSLLDNPATTESQIQSELNSLRVNLPNALVTTYTYAPLIGLRSTTDAKGMINYYEYDSLQRLKHVKDQNGNIVKSYDYHYKP